MITLQKLPFVNGMGRPDDSFITIVVDHRVNELEEFVHCLIALGPWADPTFWQALSSIVLLIHEPVVIYPEIDLQLTYGGGALWKIHFYPEAS